SPYRIHAPATPELYTLSLHDALPICAENQFHAGLAQHLDVLLQVVPLLYGRRHRSRRPVRERAAEFPNLIGRRRLAQARVVEPRSEEHTSELQSLRHLVCRLLLEKKK